MSKNITALEVIWGSVWVRAATYIVAAVFVVWLLFELSGRYSFALQVAIIGFVVAYILNPIVEALGRIRIGRAFAVVLVYLMLSLLLLLGSVLVSQVVVQTSEFIRRTRVAIPAAIESFSSLIERVSAWLAGFRESLPDFLTDRIGVEATGGDVDNCGARGSGADYCALRRGGQGRQQHLTGASHRRPELSPHRRDEHHLDHRPGFSDSFGQRLFSLRLSKVRRELPALCAAALATPL